MGKESEFLLRRHMTGQEAHGTLLSTTCHSAGRPSSPEARLHTRRTEATENSARRRGDAGDGELLSVLARCEASRPLWQTVWGFFEMLISVTM